MQKQKLVAKIGFLFLYLLILAGEITVLILKSYATSLYLLVPACCLVPIYLTFERVPKETNYHVFHLVLLILARYFLIAISLLLPVLLTVYIPSLKADTSVVYTFISASEVLAVYLIIFLEYVLPEKENKGKPSDSAK